MRWLGQKLKDIIRFADIIDAPEITPPDVGIPYEGHEGEVIAVSTDGTQLTFEKPKYDMAVFIPGVFDANQMLIKFKFSRNVTFPALLPDSQGELEIASTDEFVVSFRKGVTEFATLTVGAGSISGEFSQPAQDTDFLVGEVLTVYAPDPADGTAEGLSFTLNGERGP
jgi:hypothetical protein